MVRLKIDLAVDGKAGIIKWVVEGEGDKELCKKIVENIEKCVKYGPHPYIAVDAVVYRNGKFLLVRRKNEPYRGYYALPGGFVEYGERVEDAVLRELMEETRMNGKIAGIVGVYSDPSRDPRGHTISVAFLVLAQGDEQPIAGDDACEISWFDAEHLPMMAFDHDKIVRDAINLLRNMGYY
ncbi:MAG: NUDIX hydrolase [Thermoplasmata archaeon]|nr:MAG: NUDIX hydrolase [Thermoplasmata archaeon]